MHTPVRTPQCNEEVEPTFYGRSFITAETGALPADADRRPYCDEPLQTRDGRPPVQDYNNKRRTR